MCITFYNGQLLSIARYLTGKKTERLTIITVSFARTVINAARKNRTHKTSITSTSCAFSPKLFVDRLARWHCTLRHLDLSRLLCMVLSCSKCGDDDHRGFGCASLWRETIKDDELCDICRDDQEWMKVFFDRSLAEMAVIAAHLGEERQFRKLVDMGAPLSGVVQFSNEVSARWSPRDREITREYRKAGC